MNVAHIDQLRALNRDSLQLAEDLEVLISLPYQLPRTQREQNRIDELLNKAQELLQAAILLGLYDQQGINQEWKILTQAILYYQKQETNLELDKSGSD